LCPRNPRDVEQRFESDEVFVVAQRRRAQSEGRIGILKNPFLDWVPRAKGFKNRSLQVSYTVLAHNLLGDSQTEMGSGKKRISCLELPEAACRRQSMSQVMKFPGEVCPEIWKWGWILADLL
jgi:hypothetical protein